MSLIDLIGNIRRIQNASAAETFDQSTDSLEALSNAIAAIGFGPGVSLWMFGRCAAAMAPSTTVITTDNLGVTLPDDVFNNEFWMQVIHNVTAPGTAPEREIRRITDFVGATQTFTTDGFTANLEPGDLVAIFHESILPLEILGYGTLDTSSATVPADSTRTEANNYFRGHTLMTTEGAVRFRPTRIVEYTGVGGIFTVDPNNPLPAATGLVDYVIVGGQAEFVPAADAVTNRTPADVIGNKTDTAAGNSLVARTVVPLANSVNNAVERDVVGNKADAATLDDMSALATATLVAEIKRVLLRISPAAFSVTIDNGGAARTDLDAILTDLAAMLAGAAGITTWLGRVQAGNGVSFAEVLRYISELKPEWGAEVTATHNTASAAEETIFTTAVTTPGLLHLELTLRTMVAGDDFTIRLYNRVDGANYDLASEQQIVGNPTLKLLKWVEYASTVSQVRLTIQRNSGTNRGFVYLYRPLAQPVA